MKTWIQEKGASFSEARMVVDRNSLIKNLETDFEGHRQMSYWQRSLKLLKNVMEMGNNWDLRLWIKKLLGDSQ